MNPKIKKIVVSAVNTIAGKASADVLVLGLFEKTDSLPGCYKEVDKIANGQISRLIASGDFKAGANELAVVYVEKAAFSRVMLVGLGDSDKLTLENIRQAAGSAVRAAGKIKAKTLAIDFHTIADDVDMEHIGQAITEGAFLGRYDYQDYLAKDKIDTSTLKVNIIASQNDKLKALRLGIKTGTALANGQMQARILGNAHGGDINPGTLAKAAQKIAKENKLKCKIFDDKMLKQMKMNGILSVGQGSANKPCLIMLTHQGRPGNAIDVVLVGKAITFDSGGLSLKPSDSMATMKNDKCGGCSTIGAIMAASQLGIKKNIVALIPAAENMPDGNAYRPSDIFVSYSGKTVEVLNTDAEGRLILCDALAYGAEMKPKAMIDMATLTGAAVVALGSQNTALLGNNQELIDALKKASVASGESLWQLPCDESYLEPMRSKVADLQNTGGRQAGTCCAAAFLGEFVGQTSWAHLDIAAVADTGKEKPYRAIGATGQMVRTVVEYLRSL